VGAVQDFRVRSRNRDCNSGSDDRHDQDEGHEPGASHLSGFGRGELQNVRAVSRNLKCPKRNLSFRKILFCLE